MKSILVCLVAGLWLVSSVASVSASEVVWEDMSKGVSGITSVLPLGDGAKQVYIGAKGGVYKLTDNSVWRNILSLRGKKGRVNLLVAVTQNKSVLYAATSGGLFCSNDNANSWKRIYKGRNDPQSDCIALAVCGKMIYLGTKQGLFTSPDLGRSWHKESGKVGDSQILALESIYPEQDEVYAATTEGVFKKSKDKDWEKIFVPHPQQEEPDQDFDQDDGADINTSVSDIRYLAASLAQSPNLYLATSRGVYISTDRGISWDILTDYGLLSRDVKFILATSHAEVYAATGSGIFKFTDKRWQEISFALAAGEPRFLAEDNAGNIYAVCDKGLFRAARAGCISYQGDSNVSISNSEEPSIEEIQKAAIKYAEVSPQKIKFWRRQAGASALMPKVSAGVSRDNGDLWHWESGSSTKTGDDFLMKGRDSLGWDVRLSWDLSQVIWNPDQTSIDSRSKLMVELRNDILDEVNKIYFERLRVKLELDDLRIEDRKKRSDKELRIRELTASLDGLTGGYFSRKAKRS